MTSLELFRPVESGMRTFPEWGTGQYRDTHDHFDISAPRGPTWHHAYVYLDFLLKTKWSIKKVLERCSTERGASNHFFNNTCDF